MSIHDLRSKHQGIAINTRDGINSYEYQTRVVEDPRTVTNETVIIANGKRQIPYCC